MVSEELLARLKQGAEAWNRWRLEYRDVRPHLRGAFLAGANLTGADLAADLAAAELRGADLTGAHLREANLGSWDQRNKKPA